MCSIYSDISRHNGQDWDLQIWCLNASFAVVQLHTPHACAPCYRLQPSFYIKIIYYHTNITVASHVHKITGRLTICSIVCSVKEKEKIRNTTQYWSFLDKSTGCRRLPLRDSKADSVPWYYNQQELSAHFFNILTTLDYFLQSKTTWFKSRYAFVLLTFP